MSTEERLMATGQEGGLKPHRLAGDRGSVVVTEYGARVLGLFLTGVEENLLWTNPDAVADARRARDFVNAGGWNMGGDRVWVAPEIELHFLDPQHPKHDNYAVPPDLDPGQYSVAQSDVSGVAFKNRGSAKNLVSGGEFAFEASRTIRLCAPPLPTGDLSYVGYEIASDLTITQPDRDDACYGLWQLMQIPPGGEILIPARPNAEKVDYFNTNVEAHIAEHPDHLVFPVTGTAQHKLGLRAGDTHGLMGYFRRAGKQATLIVRQVAVFAGATYADYPQDARARRDIALQFYNDSGDAGGFGEMEYHSVAATRESFFQTRDVSRTWCLGGPEDAVRAIAAQLLRIDD